MQKPQFAAIVFQCGLLRIQIHCRFTAMVKKYQELAKDGKRKGDSSAA
jgi:hypothetical protein